MVVSTSFYQLNLVLPPWSTNTNTQKTYAVRGAQLANGLLCWLLMLCFAKGTAKGIANALLRVLLMLCYGHGIACFRQWLPVIYKLVCLKFNSLSKYHAEPPTLTRLGASADFLSIELK